MAPVAQVVLTRPLAESLHWQAQLQERGIDAAVLPLIDIGSAFQPETVQALHTAVAQLSSYHAIMFVSSNAVRFLLQAPGAAAALQQATAAGTTRAWAPGPGTRHALVQAGLAPQCIDSPLPDAAQFDSESLWQQVAHQVQPGCRVLVVRGASMTATASSPSSLTQGSGREWLAATLRERGARVDFLGVYQRQIPAATEALQAAIDAHCDARSWWLFSSSEAITHLQLLAPERIWHDQRAVVTHPRIAQAAQQAQFGAIQLCRPSLHDVCASIESLL